MDKLKMETPDMVAGNIEKIGALFPAAVTEMRGEDGQIKMGINFEMLKQLLSRDVVDGDECYEFTWVGKKAAMAEAARPITKTLRPVKEDSCNWDTTENLYIEGDNLEVLKILQESYLGKIKMIYIDPPYNTGHDFIYRDDFAISQEEWSEKSGEWSEDGNRLFENTESNGRFHSDWCSMIYSRLMLARNVLSDHGLIAISIDDNEQENLKKICDEIFGAENFIALLSVIVKTEGRRYGGVAKTHEYLFLYAKNISNTVLNEIEIEGKQFRYQDSGGGFNIQELRNQNARAFNSTNRPNLRYPFYVDIDNVDENGFCKVFLEAGKGLCEVYPITVNGYKSVWRWGRNEKATLHLEDLIARKGSDGIIRVYQKMRKLTEMPKTVLIDKNYLSIKGTREVQELLGLGVFDFPKPIALIKLITNIITNDEDYILDLFSGSATTAHAVMQLNAEDGGHRKFIMVQLPEPCDEKSEAFNAGYKNICEIGKERIRRAGDKIKAEHPEADLDTGFRVFRVDSSNMKDVYYHPEELDQQSMFDLVSNIKDDRTDLDLLYACLLDWGVEIHLPHTSIDLDGCTVHNVDNGALMACFSPNVPRSVVEHMAKQQPLRAVFRDSAFATDAEKINVTEIFKNLSPDTKVKVI